MAESFKLTRLPSLKTAADFRAYVAELGVEIPCDDNSDVAALGESLEAVNVNGKIVGNRFAIHPMEGWDGTKDGRPTELTTRRWKNFGRSGAKLIWGGEAVAVQKDVFQHVACHPWLQFLISVCDHLTQ